MKRQPNSAVDPELVARIAASAADQSALTRPPSLCGAWRIDNPYSTVWCLRLCADGWSRRYFVKQSRVRRVDSSGLARQFQREHAMLSRLENARLPCDAARAVTPLAFYPDIPALATVAAEGTTLRRAYARDARRWSAAEGGRRLCRLAELAGAWLAAFQDHTLAGIAAFPADELLHYLRVRLERLKSRGTPLMQQALDALEDGVRRRASRLDGGGVTLCARHNDFASHNLIVVDGPGLRVLDFQACDTGAAAFDPCNFWLELELLKLDPSYSAPLLAKMQHAFLAGYGRIQPDDPAFELARLRYTVNRLLNELGDPRRLRRLSWRWRRTVGSTTSWLQQFGAAGGAIGPTDPR